MRNLRSGIGGRIVNHQDGPIRAWRNAVENTLQTRSNIYGFVVSRYDNGERCVGKLCVGCLNFELGRQSEDTPKSDLQNQQTGNRT